MAEPKYVVTGQDVERLKKLYYQDRLSQKQVAYRMRISVGKLREIMKANGLEARGKESEKKYPSKEVMRYEDRPYEETFDGRVLTKTVAVLECGHIVKVWEKNVSYSTEFRHYRHCRICPLEVEGEPSDGGAAD
jgi:hypothetical protein